MNFNSILKALFGDKSSRDMKKIQPFVEKVLAVSPQKMMLRKHPDFQHFGCDHECLRPDHQYSDPEAAQAVR
jgi:hypothetical protein